MSQDYYENMSSENDRREGSFSAESKSGNQEHQRFFRKERVGSSNNYGYTQRPRFNRYNNAGEEGGYQSTPRYNAGGEQQAGRRPRFNATANNYRRPQGNDYNQQGGYSATQNGYSQQGNYGQRSYHRENGEGGYNSQNGYRPTGGYRQQQGGYNDNRFGKRSPGYSAGRNEGYGNHYNAGYNNGGANDGRHPAGNRTQGRNFYQRNNEGYAAGGNGNYQRRPAGGRPYASNNYNPNAKYSQKKRLEYKEKNVDPNAPLRLNKFLANAGICSRRDADKYITSGVVTVNGNVVTELGTKVLRSDTIMFHDQPVKMEKKVYVLLNKPKGYVTTSEDPQNRKIVMDLVKDACPERIYPVGRLDRSTTGVLLFTNDGELASKLTHPKYLKKKIYHVHTDRNVTAADMRQIAEGITLEDGEIKADAIEYASETDKKQVGIEIHSGKNRIVRRIFEHLGYHVVKLDRVYFAGLTKKNVKRGDWRYLTEKEVDMLRMGAFE
jgi:23S rRNA pseudouridine2605 synthase